MVVMPVVGIYPTVLARELLSLIILAFLVNLLDTFIPRGKSILGWFCLRLITVGLSMGLHLLVHWAFNTYAPTMIAIFFMGGVQLAFMGFLGEYILAINERVKNRPLVIEEKRLNFTEDSGEEAE